MSQKSLFILADNIPLNKWSMVGVAYLKSTGRGILFLNDQKKDESDLLSGGMAHNTQSDIKMGVKAFDPRCYKYVMSQI